MSSSTEASCGMMLVFSEPRSTVGVMVFRSSALRSGSDSSQARPRRVLSAAAALESQILAWPVWSWACALKKRSTAGVSRTGVWYATTRLSARTRRSTGLSPSGTEPWEVVPFTTSFFHQVRFSPTSMPNQRTFPSSTRVSAPSVRTYSISFTRSGCFSTKVREPSPPISSSALPT